jgi:hypothetical protein
MTIYCEKETFIMKTTKARLRQIIKEELSAILDEATLPKEPEAASRLAAMDAVDDLRAAPPLGDRPDPEDLSDEDILGTTDPERFSGSSDDARQKLLNRLLIRSQIDKMSPKQREELAGGDPEVLKLINAIADDDFLVNPTGALGPASF